MRNPKKTKFWKIFENKENALLIALIVGIILLSVGIAIIKIFPKFGTSLIIVGSSFIYFSIIILAFVV
jgi:hypothetical protein